MSETTDDEGNHCLHGHRVDTRQCAPDIVPSRGTRALIAFGLGTTPCCSTSRLKASQCLCRSLEISALSGLGRHQRCRRCLVLLTFFRCPAMPAITPSNPPQHGAKSTTIAKGHISQRAYHPRLQTHPHIKGLAGVRSTRLTAWSWFMPAPLPQRQTSRTCHPHQINLLVGVSNTGTSGHGCHTAVRTICSGSHSLNVDSVHARR